MSFFFSFFPRSVFRLQFSLPLFSFSDHFLLFSQTICTFSWSTRIRHLSLFRDIVFEEQTAELPLAPIAENFSETFPLLETLSALQFKLSTAHVAALSHCTLLQNVSLYACDFLAPNLISNLCPRLAHLRRLTVEPSTSSKFFLSELDGDVLANVCPDLEFLTITECGKSRKKWRIDWNDLLPMEKKSRTNKMWLAKEKDEKEGR